MGSLGRDTGNVSYDCMNSLGHSCWPSMAIVGIPLMGKPGNPVRRSWFNIEHGSS